VGSVRAIRHPPAHTASAVSRGRRQAPVIDPPPGGGLEHGGGRREQGDQARVERRTSGHPLITARVQLWARVGVSSSIASVALQLHVYQVTMFGL